TFTTPLSFGHLIFTLGQERSDAEASIMCAKRVHIQGRWISMENCAANRTRSSERYSRNNRCIFMAIICRLRGHRLDPLPKLLPRLGKRSHRIAFGTNHDYAPRRANPDLWINCPRRLSFVWWVENGGHTCCDTSLQS